MRLADTSGGLSVYDDLVGTLARNADGLVLFQYDQSWVSQAFQSTPTTYP